MTKSSSFLELITKHFSGDPKFKLSEHLSELEDNDRYDESCDSEQDAILGALPEAKLLAESSIYNIAYHGRDCTAFSKRIYLYRDYYITTTFDNEGNDCSVMNFTDMGEGLMSFYKKDVQVYSKEKFGLTNAMKFLPTDELDVLIVIYQHFSPKDGLSKLQKHIETLYLRVKK